MTRLLERGARATVDYCRISLDKSGSAEGVGSQHDENEDAAAELGVDIARTYTDNDLSAFSGVERPEYKRLLSDMKAGLIDLVIIWHANRLHRTSEEVNAFIKIARERGVRLYSTTKGAFYNLEKASGRKELRDDTSAAEYESEHRGERVTIARKRQARQGAYGGGVRPYGWGVDNGRVRSVCVNPKAPPMERRYEDRTVLDMTQHNQAEAAEIRRWARELLSGVTMGQLLRDLARNGVPTAAQTDGRTLRKNGKTVEHRGWGSNSVRAILTHPRTSGHMVYQGEIIRRNALPYILPEDTRQALIAMFADPKRKTSPGNVPRWPGSLIYQCGLCNNGTTVSASRRNGRMVYRCNALGHCSQSIDDVDRYVRKVIIARLGRADLADLLPNQGNRLSAEEIADLRQEMAALEQRKRDAARRWALLKMDDAELDEARATADERIEEIRVQLRDSTAESPLAEFLLTDDAAQTWDGLTLGRQREILKMLVTVKLMPTGRGRSEKSIPITDRVKITPIRRIAPTLSA
ncbi:recombinase family protein [Streptosporangium sp. NPDC001681]|uniref:recombinase family protein n=1 Tax=Streptosporangium sp. NPDC001681 TaxID=3154395 RepID=UPI00331BF1B8